LWRDPESRIRRTTAILCEAECIAMNQPPFAVEDELYHNLYITRDKPLILRKSKHATSSSQSGQSRPKTYLPGQPRIALKDPDLGRYLESELVTGDLDRLSPHLWLVATQDSSHISSLTAQLVRGRRLVITENPELHLVWVYDVVYVKPIPKYLLSHAFWDFYLVGSHSPIPEPQREKITMAALGFLRSYLYLIRHKSDFVLATDEKLRLLPKGVRYSDFVNFIMAFEKIADTSVSPRYSFGQLRLTRLNLWSKVFLRRFTFHKIHGQYGAYFARYYGPVLFIFGFFSVALSAMQVALAAQPAVEPKGSWLQFTIFSRIFSVCALFIVAIAALLLLFILFALIIREAVFALKDLYYKKRSRYKPEM
jgi:hypothetical protein